MNKDISKKYLFLLVIFISCFSISLLATAYALGPWHVKKGNTVPYYIDNAISSAGVYSIVVADNQWNNISNRQVYLQQQSTRTSQTGYVQDSKFEIFPVAIGTSGGILGQTHPFSVYNGLLVEADIALNISYPLGNDPVAPTSYSVRRIVTHEFGHVIGLNDSSYNYNYSVMSATMPTGSISYILKQDDISGYNNIPW